MSRARLLRMAALWTLAGATGCTHNYYYYGAAPLCEPTPAVIEYGAVCEVPSPGGAVVVAEAPTPRRVVVGRPQNRIGSAFAWKRPDPEALATTRVEGGLEDVTVR